MENNSDISAMITTLLTAPSIATIDSMKAQRIIWKQWLEDINALVKKADINAQQQIIDKHLDIAPTWKMTAQISLSLSMRVASINRKDGKFVLGLGIGPVQASGEFGFMSQSTSEGSMHASVKYNLTNDNEITLRNYMDTLGVTKIVPENIEDSIKKLNSESKDKGSIDGKD